MTSTVTTDFREEYEAARETLLRRRFLWYAGVVGVFYLLVAIPTLLLALGLFSTTQPLEGIWIQFGRRTASAMLYIVSFFIVRKRTMDRKQMLRWVSRLIVANGLLVLLIGPAIVQFSLNTSQALDAATVQQEEAVRNLASLFVVLSVLMTHFVASLFIPWTPREALRPIVPLIVAYAILALFLSDADFWIRIIAIVLSPLVAVPGVLIAAWRHGRFRKRFHFKMLKGRYGEMKQDLGVARQIHDAMFPEPLLTGPVRFEYRYEPMRQIGGDYLFARMNDVETGDLPVLNLAIVDVTGHGIGAALTVNRLHGEIERLLGEKPKATPGDLLTGLNNYLHHTLASHSVYATAIFMRIDVNANTLDWASAGHPPAFLRAIDGTLDRLDSTTLVLGACKGDDFHPNDQSTRFGPGDVLVAYTDGATESRNDKGRMLGVDGLQRLIANGHPDEEGGWAASVLREVDAHRYGPPQDDTLIVEIFRPLNLTGEAYVPPTR